MDNKNLPAYPVTLERGDVLNSVAAQDGLSKRELGAFMAPDNIPEWFTADFTEKPKEPKSWLDLPDTDPFKQELKNWHQDPCYDLPEELEWYQQAWDNHRKETKEWRQQKEMNTYFKWRIYYSETLLTHLENTSK